MSKLNMVKINSFYKMKLLLTAEKNMGQITVDISALIFITFSCCMLQKLLNDLLNCAKIAV